MGIQEMKNKSLLLICVAILILSGCGHSTKQESDSTAAAVNEMNADALLDLFIDGEIMAYYVDVDREPFYITDLPSEPGDFTCYSVGDRIDLDNDGAGHVVDERRLPEEYDELKMKMLGE